MSANSDLRRTVSRRFAPFIADIEELVHREGYLRTLAATITTLGSVGLIGQLLGIAWLRTTFATFAAVLFVLVSAVSFAGTQRLRSRIDRDEALLHDYAESLYKSPATVIREWKQEVVIESTGDTHFSRTLVLGDSGSDTPRYVSLGIVRFDRSPMSERSRRRVTYSAVHASRPHDLSGGTRVHTTASWTKAPTGERLTVYAHLGRTVQDGDLLTLECSWPRFSTELMSGKAPETFEARFAIPVAWFEHRVVFRCAGHTRRLGIRPLPGTEVVRERRSGDTVVTFRGSNPELLQPRGFVADLAE
ncbi:hypothetical protein [Amycolatopsis saalfeldensis]|uniref:Uncharacterized protein n=1 Tax=Amycolatopsis saalfeldensis TaxID=394193 RepID=A0A1H8YI16_9PSEU|nr:hypothetical protein [Amycolatopsis saalfeldensis]SEP51809.1 hypothetical protein SAMN04489732_117127 [Amycolatopsis saalfeldensis]